MYREGLNDRHQRQAAGTACGEQREDIEGRHGAKFIAIQWFWKTSDASAENAGSSETKAKIFSQSSALNRPVQPSTII